MLGKVLLVVLFTIGFLSTYKPALDNGLFEKINNLINEPESELLGSDIRMQLGWVKGTKLHRPFGAILTVFYPIFSGKRSQLTTLGLHFYGQLIARR